MSELQERTLVHCSINQAPSHLAHYFKIRGNAAGDITKLSLRADVPVPGSKDGMRFERTALATLVPRREPATGLVHYGVTWAPEGAGPYPTFHGDLAIESADDYDSFYLVLTGTYEPPFGAAGAAFDAVLGHRIAQQSGRNLLSTIADSIEADFTAVEAGKAAERRKDGSEVSSSDGVHRN